MMKRCAAFLLCMILVVSGPVAQAADPVSIGSGRYSPGTLKEGQSYSFNGLISSRTVITDVTVGVYNRSNGSKVQEKSAKPYAYSYNINRLDSYIKFGQLKAGNYLFKVTATVGVWPATTYTLVNRSFAVEAKAAASTLKIDEGRYSPGTLVEGQTYSFGGNISSNYKISMVRVGVYRDSAGTNAAIYRTAYPNANYYNINKLDSQVRFATLKAGTYYFRVIATDARQTLTLVNNPFTVTAKPPESTLTLASGRYSPGTLNVGQAYSISGQITSNYTINSVTVGIYDSSGTVAKQTKSVNPNTKSYNISSLDSYIKFGLLAAGSYVFKVTARDASGKTIGTNYSFRVIQNVTPVNNFSYRTMAQKVHEVQGSKMCVLTSISMLVRSKLYLDNKAYLQITQNVIRYQYNNGSLNANWGTICNNANRKSGASGRMTYTIMSGTATAKMNQVLNLLKNRKEGVVVYFHMNSNNQHAVRICNYDGQFYVSDPGRSAMSYVPITQSLIGNGHYAWGRNYWSYASKVVYYS